jgi:uncharacterized repeat protein (TIGR01451 family)
MSRPDLSTTPARIAAASLVIAAFLVSPFAAGLRDSQAAGGAGRRHTPASRRPAAPPRPEDGGEAAPLIEQEAAKPRAEFEFVPGEALVRFRSEAKAAAAEAAGARFDSEEDRGGAGVRVSRFEGSEIVSGLRLARFEAADTLAAVAALNRRPDVLYAEPNYVWRAKAVPNDPLYVPNAPGGSSLGQYGMERISAPAAWDTTQGSQSVVVAVIDTGVDLLHPDLVDNAWTNPGEVAGDNIDNDGNGFVDDVNGWDFHHNDRTVYDAADGDDHGTHVAGTIGARGHNGIGVAGVNWRVSLMSVKVLGPSGGFTSNIIAGYNYVRLMKQRGTNVRVTNNSYGGPGRSQAALDAINALNAEGVLFVAAAGNAARDNFNYPFYPASYSAPNLLAVASTTSSDSLSGFSNFSSRLVSMGAPGSGILSTIPNGNYAGDNWSGTSMATPHVAGAAALLLSAAPGISVANLRGALAFTGDRVGALQNNTTTGRRLNVKKALDAALEVSDTGSGGTAPASTTLSVVAQSGRSLTLSFAAPGDDGFAGKAADYDFYFVNPALGVRVLLPTNAAPAAGGTQQQVAVGTPYRGLGGAVELVAYDERGNQSTSSLAINVGQGAAADPFVIQTSAPESLSAGGTRLALDGDDKYLAGHALPFAFPFYGQQRTQLTVSTNGVLYFSTPPRRSDGDANDAGGSIAALQGQTLIAGLWDDLEIDTAKRADAGVFVAQPSADRVIFRWQATTYPLAPLSSLNRGVNAVNFEVELRADGTVLTRYGGGNTNVVPVVAISGGEPSAYDVPSHTSEGAPRNLTSAQTVAFAPRQARADALGCGNEPTPIGLGATATGALAPGDCRHPGNDSFYDAYTFEGVAGQLVTVTMLSPAPGQTGGFDTYLYLLRPGETALGPGTIRNDDGEGSGSTDTLDSAIVAVLTETGTYTILANSAQPAQTGSYSLSLRGGCAAVPAAANATASAALAAGDCRLPNGSFADAYSFTGAAGERVAVEMRSAAVDSFLYLLSTDGFTELARDDDGFDTADGRNFDARIPQNSGLITLPAAGTYYVLASSFDPGATGDYQLRLLTPELSVGMLSSPASLAVGGDITYDITVANAGSPAAGVSMTDSLPAGVQLLSAAPSQGSCSGTNTAVTCGLGGMAAGGAATIRIVVRTLTAGTKVNSASVAGPEAERNTANNTAQRTTEVSASVSGRVLDGGTGAPLGGVTVTLSGSQSGTTQTDSGGSYSFAGLAGGGTYTVTPSLTNHTFAPPAHTFSNLSTNQTGDFSATLNTHAVSGRVADGANSPLAGVSVALSGSRSATTTTDASGNFAFASLPAGGTYTVTPASANHTFTPPSRTFANLSSNQTGDFAGTLKTFAISGRVADAANGSLAGVGVTLSGAQSAAAQTDASGNYSFPGLPAGGTYTVTPSKANYNFAPPSRTFANLSANQTGDFTASLISYAVAGRVADGANNPLPGVAVALSGSLSGVAQTDAAGNFSFSSLPAGGTYTVTPSLVNHTFTPPSQTFVNLQANRAADFTGTRNTFTVSGRVADSSGVGLPGVGLALSGSQSAAATTDASGNYTFAGLPAGGSYTVTPALANYTFTPPARAFNNLSSNQTGDFVATLNRHSISGRVADGANAPLANVTVTLSGTPSATAQTNADGGYSFASLPAGGSYTVTPSLANYNFAPPARTFNSLSADQRADFAGARNTHAVSGRVADGANNGLAGVTLTLSGAQTAAAQTDAQGNYSFPNLAAGGDYTVTPSKANYTFTPPSRSFANLGADQSANFAAASVPASIQFAASSFAAGEGGGAAVVTVTRTVNTSIAVSVNYSTAGGTAAAGSDYEAASASGTLSFAAGEEAKTFSVKIIEDPQVEGAETVTLQLAGPSANALLGSPASAVLTIQDNDSCSYVVEPGDRQQFDAAGGQGTATMIAPEGCAWRATSRDPWLTITSGASGTGNGTISFTVAPNTGPQRVGTIIHTDDAFYHVLQSSGCAYSIAPSARTVAAAGGTVSVAVTTSDPGCSWAAASDSDFIAVPPGANGVGNGTVTLTVSANAGHAGRSGTATIAGQTFTVTQPPDAPFVLFGPAAFHAGEGDARATVTVTRGGDLSAPASVTVETVDDPAAVPCDPTATRPDGTEYPKGAAYARCDYSTTIETVAFAAGDAGPREVSIPLVDDGHAEGPETVLLRLAAPEGAALGTRPTATLAIADNDVAGAPNPISGSEFFVRMQYLDFLSREPEASGMRAWLGVLNGCPDVFNTDPASPSAGCDRLLVSQSFFQSNEFQLKGYYAFLFYRVALDRRPAYSEIVADMRNVTGRTAAEVFEKRARLAASFARRADFKARYDGLSNRDYVDALLGRYGLQQITTEDPQQPDGTNQVTLTAGQLADALGDGTLTRAQVLRAVVQSSEVDAAEYHGAFVAMQYYGYLRRTPEQSGYDAWLRVIKQDPNNVRIMIDGFANSAEYRLRFGPR